MKISKRHNEYVGNYLKCHDRVINGVFYRFITTRDGVIEVIRFVSHPEDCNGGHMVHLFKP